MKHQSLDRKHATALRSALERARDAEADIQWLARFPHACCNFAANLLIIELASIGIGPLRRMIGAIQDEDGSDIDSHVWVVANRETLIDITADCHGLDSVIVATESAWHTSLNDVRPFIERIDLEEGMSEMQIQRLGDLYEEPLEILEQFKYQINCSC